MDVPDLTGLWNSFAISEPLEGKVLGGIVDVLVEAKVKQKTAGRGTSSPFTWIAVYHDHILRITC